MTSPSSRWLFLIHFAKTNQSAHKKTIPFFTIGIIAIKAPNTKLKQQQANTKQRFFATTSFTNTAIKQKQIISSSSSSHKHNKF
mmetsp:Transcript_16606/g.31578  ORF Transcript_16606/g.31578 Transcript_16606/m.31578 type:complete len:84 (-) Transcript_16606:3422-3673(-)